MLEFLVSPILFGVGIVTHVAQKLFGWFRGYGFRGTGVCCRTECASGHPDSERRKLQVIRLLDLVDPQCTRGYKNLTIRC
jgi:hypothetical protein